VLNPIANPPAGVSAPGGLAYRIAAVLVVKIVGLAVLWYLFVRDERVPVDAQTTAVAFGLVAPASESKMQLEGKAHGQ
jgi:hypothetical protein